MNAFFVPFVDNPVSTCPVLNIEKTHFQGISLNKLPAWFYLIAHQGRENLISRHGIFNLDLQKATGIGIQGGFKQLLRIHFAQAFIPLDVLTLSGFGHHPVKGLHEIGDMFTFVIGGDKGIVAINVIHFVTKVSEPAIIC